MPQTCMMGAAGQPLFGQLLKSRRMEAELTQEALAERAGVSVRGIRALEGGNSRPQRETAQRLAVALGLQDTARQQFLLAATPAPRRSAASQSSQPAPSLLPLSTLPMPPTAMIGRDDEAADIAALLRDDAIRMVTITGPGGVGKTRLSLAVAAGLGADFPHGVVFISLGPLHSADLVVATIAATLGQREVGAEPLLTTLARFLRQRRILLLLDNFEHVAAAAPDIAALLSATPGLRVLATSRVPLHLQGEQLFPLSPLPLPACDAPEPDQAEAVRLFVQRAKRVRPQFALDAANVGAVAQITRRLDGLPLAIELAAARSAVLSPQALLDRLDHPLSILTNGALDLPARHQTLRNTIAWSYDLLTGPQQALFRRLSICAGGCSPAAAAAIYGPDEPDDVLDGLAALTEASLLQTQEDGSGNLRFTMLATIREYGLERLAQAGEQGTIRRRHADYYFDLAVSYERDYYSARQIATLNMVEADLDNLRLALALCLEQPGDAALLDAGLSAAANLYPLWHLRGRYSEALLWLDQLLATPGAQSPGAGRVLALASASHLNAIVGHRARAFAQSRECLALAQGIGDTALLARGYHALGSLDVVMSTPKASLSEGDAGLLETALRLTRAAGESHREGLALIWVGFRLLRSGDFASAAAHFSAGLAHTQALGDRWSSAMGLTGLAEATWFSGDSRRARQLAEESLALHQQLSDQHGSGHMFGMLGDLAREAGDTAAARLYYSRSIAALRSMGEAPRSVRNLWGLAALAASNGDAYHALTLAGAATALSQQTLLSPYSREAIWESDLWQPVLRLLSPTEQAEAWASGQSMALDRAIAVALDEREAAFTRI